MRSLAVSFLLLPTVLAAVGKNGVGRLPALGWNSWNAFDCKIDGTKFLNAAKRLVELGLRVWS
jgi:alpha-galactosidase